MAGLQKIGDVEQKFIQLKEEASNLERKIQDISPDVSSLETRVEKYKQNVGNVERNLDTITTTMSDLQNRIQKEKKCVEENLSPKIRSLQSDVDDMNIFVTNLHSKVDSMNIDVPNIETKIDKIQPKVDSLEIDVSNMQTTVDNLHPPVDDLETNVSNMKTTVDEMRPKVDNLETDVGTIKRNVEEIHPKVDSMKLDVPNIETKIDKIQPKVDKLETDVRNMQTTVDKMLPKVGNMKSEVAIMNPKVVDLKTDVRVMSTAVDRQRRSLTQSERAFYLARNRTEGKVSAIHNRTLKLEDTTEEMYEVLTHLGNYSWKQVPMSHNRIDMLEITMRSLHTMMYVLALVTIAVACGEVYSLVLVPNVRYVSPQSPTAQRDTDESRPVRSVLEDIQPTTLEKQICLVSFYSETQARHRRLVDSVCTTAELLRVTRVPSLVGKHEQIPKLPRAKIYLVFVDFNERDIILENPEREVGDLRLTTVQGTRRLGGDVYVVYVKDKGSRELTSGQLYNQRMSSITIHPELADMSSRQRVLTVYEEFSEYQRGHLAKNFIRTLQK